MRRALTLLFLITTCSAAAFAQVANPDDKLEVSMQAAALLRAVPADSLAAYCVSQWTYRNHLASIEAIAPAEQPVAPQCATRAILVQRPQCWFRDRELYEWFVVRRYAMIVALCVQEHSFIAFHWPSQDPLKIS